MLVLVIDTTSEHGGVGIYRDAECLASVANDGPANVYSVTLFQMVERALAEARSQDARLQGGLGGIDLFAAANGPGSFTGIRVGLAAAQGWAKATEHPARGVSVLEAMAEEAQPATELAVPILDARRGEFFLRVFRRTPANNSGTIAAGSNARKHGEAQGRRGLAAEEGKFIPAEDGLVLKPAALEQFLDSLSSKHGEGFTCVVREPDAAARSLLERLPQTFRWQSVRMPLLGAIARRALRAHREAPSPAPAELDAYYIRRSDAELGWRD